MGLLAIIRGEPEEQAPYSHITTEAAEQAAMGLIDHIADALVPYGQPGRAAELIMPSYRWIAYQAVERACATGVSTVKELKTKVLRELGGRDDIAERISPYFQVHQADVNDLIAYLNINPRSARTFFLRPRVSNRTQPI